jgi:5-formyltetrahydrofolate cyclo-ligase
VRSEDGNTEASRLRRAALELRDALPIPERAARSSAIWKRLVEVPEFRDARQALFFVSFGSEVDTAPMRERARILGMAVAVPKCVPATKSMRFHLAPSERLLLPGAYGILEPPEDAPEADLTLATAVLVPGSAFDRNGNRLGMGAGYYDRWLPEAGRGMPRIGLAFDVQLFDAVPVQAWDQPLDILVTDRETLRFRR